MGKQSIAAILSIKKDNCTGDLYKNQIDCQDLGGNMADGFVNKCFYYGKDMEKAYLLHLKNDNRDETKYLKPEWQGEDISYKEGNVEVEYKKLKAGEYNIVLFYDGGETHVKLTEEGKDVIITTTYFPG